MHATLRNRITEVDRLMGDRLHVAGPLRAKLRQGGGRLPRALRRRAFELAQAKDLLQNPALAPRLDKARVVQTCALLERHLKSIPEHKFRRRDWSAWIGLAALRVLLVLVAFLAYVWWRGVG